MAQARFLQRSSHRLRKSRNDFILPTQLSRNFSSAFNRTLRAPKLPVQSTSQSHIVWVQRQWTLPPAIAGPALRFASTEAKPTLIAEIQPGFAASAASPPPAPPVNTFVPAESDSSLESLDKIINKASSTIHEYPGWLRDIGLDYGWGTTALLERLVEHVHMFTGTPWWGSMVIVILIVRTALLKFYFEAADTNARSVILRPLEAPILERQKEAMQSQDRAALMQTWQDRKQLRRSAGISMWKQFVPLIQIPLSFSLFRLMRGMSTLPVPGFESGGVLWFQDLTIPDPYFILPAVQTLAMYGTFVLGGEMGNNQTLNETWQRTFKYGIPGMMGYFCLSWPAGMQLTFCATITFSLLQSAALKSNRFRDFVGIQRIEGRLQKAEAYAGTLTRYQLPDADAASKPKTGMSKVISELKSGMSDMVKQGKERVENYQKPTGRRTAAELRHAKAYDERRKREIALEREAEKFERQERERENKKRKRRQ